jgi:hypothetical protein
LLVEIEDFNDPSIKHAEHLCFVYCVWITENIYFVNVIQQNFLMFSGIPLSFNVHDYRLHFFGMLGLQDVTMKYCIIWVIFEVTNELSYTL